MSQTFDLSLIDPFPNMAILQPVSSWRRLSVLPFGPNNLPTKLNCNQKQHIHYNQKTWETELIHTIITNFNFQIK